MFVFLGARPEFDLDPETNCPGPVSKWRPGARLKFVIVIVVGEKSLGKKCSLLPPVSEGHVCCWAAKTTAKESGSP